MFCSTILTVKSRLPIAYGQCYFSVVKAINDAEEVGVSVDDYLDNHPDISPMLYYNDDDDDISKKIITS